MNVGPKSKAKVKFGLCWDMPEIRFGKGGKTWRRKYSTNFPGGCEKMMGYTLENSSKWVEAIRGWQDPVLDDPGLPDWFKSAIFNEMYFIADGGTQWLEFEEDGGNAGDDDPRRKFGRFAYLESHEYRMYNTYDVHFYASIALASLFPALVRQILCGPSHVRILLRFPPRNYPFKRTFARLQSQKTLGHLEVHSTHYRHNFAWSDIFRIF